MSAVEFALRRSKLVKHSWRERGVQTTTDHAIPPLANCTLLLIKQPQGWLLQWSLNPCQRYIHLNANLWYVTASLSHVCQTQTHTHGTVCRWLLSHTASRHTNCGREWREALLLDAPWQSSSSHRKLCRRCCISDTACFTKQQQQAS